jgi:hypothetical protein
MDEYVSLTLVASPTEHEAAFTSRLYTFWTHMLRKKPDDYEKVYSEAVEYERDGGRISRQYMIQPEVAETLVTELREFCIAHQPINFDDRYSKAEASTNEWFQLEH